MEPEWQPAVRCGSQTRRAMAAMSFAALLVWLVASAPGSRADSTHLRRAIPTAHGSLQLILNPSPACDPEATFPGRCGFLPSGRVKVTSARDCRARDVKIFRINPNALVSTPGTNRRGIAPTTVGGTYDAYYPGEPFNNPVYEVTGGTRMAYRAVSPGFRTIIGNNPLRPLICKKLRSPVDDFVAPMPPPPEP